MAIFTGTGIHDPRGFALETPFYRAHGHTEAPVVIQCYLTLRCGMSCAHCLAAGTDGGTADMPLVLFDRLCREAAALGVQEMLLTGGEPLRRTDLGECVACLRHHGLTWSLNTATCPDAAQQAAIRSYPPGYVAVSMDGPPSVHDAFRGQAGAFAQAADALRFFAEHDGTTVCAGTTVTTRNLPYLEDTFALVRDSGAHRWGIHLLVPEGRARGRRDLFPSARQMRTLLGSVARKRPGFPVSLCDEMGFAGEWEPLVRDEAFYCAAGRAMCAVLPDGSVMPCSTLDPKHCEGTLARNSLAEIWRTGFAAQRTLRRPGKCARCGDWAACGGGCWLQRIHGTQCFRHLWQVPESLKAAAGIALCLGSLQSSSMALDGTGAAAVTNSANETNRPRSDAGGLAVMNDHATAVLRVMKIYSGKSGSGRYRTTQFTESIVSSFLWLQGCQNSDGSWGEPEHRTLLTALASMAFLSRGETHSSKIFGRPMGMALVFLERRGQGPRDAQDADVREEAVLAWCLAEAHALDRIPSSRQSAFDAARHFPNDRSTFWSVLTWPAFYRLNPGTSTETQSVVRIACGVPAATNGLLPCAARCLIDLQTHGSEGAPAVLSTLRTWNPEGWATSDDQPLLAALLACRVFAQAGFRHWGQWVQTFSPAVLKAQSPDGSWDIKSLGIARTSETDGMTDADARIYATALMSLCLQFPANLPSTRLPDAPPVDLFAPRPPERDIVIEIR